MGFNQFKIQSGVLPSKIENCCRSVKCGLNGSSVISDWQQGQVLFTCNR